MSRKIERVPFSWPTKIHDWNAGRVRTHDILAYKEKLVKDLKKEYKAKDEFAEAFRLKLMSQYWSRSEYEMILYIEAGRVYLEPWCGSFKEGRVDITEDNTLNWPLFAAQLLERRAWVNKETGLNYVKFDIYDQIMFRFNELLDFVWSYHHKYERRKSHEI